MSEKLYKILIVDDSKLIRDGLSKIFEEDERFQVIGEASNGKDALEAVKKIHPDVITLDINMPVMDGITTLKHLMILCPVPTVMMSSLSSEGAGITFDALRFGAVDFIQKPDKLNDVTFENQSAEICSRLEYAATVKVDLIRYIKPHTYNSKPIDVNKDESCKTIVTMGAAEGGYSSLLKIIPHLHVNESKAFLVSLYVAPEYIDLYAEYLNKYSQLQVKTAQNNEKIRAGVCYLRSGSDYMSVHKMDDGFNIHISPAPFASRKGSIDMLMFSTADVMGENSIGVILSGTGTDGSEGLNEISRVGGLAIIQEDKSCLSKSMSLTAQKNNDTEFVINDFNIADVINDFM